MKNKTKAGNSYLRFALIILISAAAGAVLGFGLMYFLKKSGGNMENVFHGIYAGIQVYSLPILTAVTVLAVILGEFYLNRLKSIGRKILRSEDEECDILDYQEEKTGAIGMNISIIVLVCSFIFLSFGYSADYIKSTESARTGFLYTCIVFCICGIYEGFWQVRYVKAIQIAHPYMKGDPSDKNFQKKWLESCDEAEREMIYRSSYKTYMRLNKFIPVLLVVTMICHLFFQTGILAVFAVAAVWLLVSLTYTGSCVSSKKKKTGRK